MMLVSSVTESPGKMSGTSVAESPGKMLGSSVTESPGKMFGSSVTESSGKMLRSSVTESPGKMFGSSLPARLRRCQLGVDGDGAVFDGDSVAFDDVGAARRRRRVVVGRMAFWIFQRDFSLKPFFVSLSCFLHKWKSESISFVER